MRTPDGGTEVGTDEVTGSDAGTIRDERDKEGRPRPSGASRTADDAGATDRAAAELDAENEDEPTRSE
jgi:hypothetical protein